MYIFKNYNNKKIYRFKTRQDFSDYLDSLSDKNSSGCFDRSNYFNEFANGGEYKTFDGYNFGGYSNGWNNEQNRFFLLGYWTRIPCGNEI